jgi:hypothetical protein
MSRLVRSPGSIVFKAAVIDVGVSFNVGLVALSLSVSCERGGKLHIKPASLASVVPVSLRSSLKGGCLA